MLYAGKIRFVLLAKVAIMALGLCSTIVAAQEILPETNADSLAPAIEKLIESGRESLKAGDAEAAARAYQEVLRLDPNYAEALYQLAIYNFQKQDYVKGFELIRKAIAQASENPFPRMVLAKALGEVGEYEEAIKEYEQVINTTDPDSLPAQAALMEMNLLRFRLAARHRDREQVLEIGTLLVKNYPRNQAVMEVVASVYTQAGYFKDAKQIYETLLSYMPNNPAIEFYLAGMYEMMRDPAQAIVHYELAVKKGEGTPIERSAKIKLGLLRGFSLLQQGDHEAANQQFKAVLELDENNILAIMNVAGYLYEQKQYKEAVEAYRKVITIQPANLDAHFRLAIVYLDMGMPIQGVRELDFVIANAPNSPIAQASQQTLDRASKKWRIDIFRKMIAEENFLADKLAQNPNDAATLTAMGSLLMQERRADEAIKYFEDAIQADNTYVDAYLKAGLYYEDTRQFEKAVNAYQLALALITNKAQEMVLRERLAIASGNMLLDKKEFAQAEENFRQAYEMAMARQEKVPEGAGSEEPRPPKVDVEVLWGLAVSNAQQGKLEEAVKWYEEVIAIAPEHMGARLNAAFAYEQLEEEEKAVAHYKAVAFSKNAPPEFKKRAEDRLDYIRRQTNGFSYAVGYSMAFDDNLNSARDNKYFEYRSDVYAGATYKYKLKKGLKLSVNATPSYSIYHRAQFDFFNFTLSPSLLFGKWGYDWDVGISRNTQSSVLRPEQSSTVTDTFNLGANWVSKDRIGYRAFMSYRGFGSSENPFFDADTVNLGINLNHTAPESTFLSYGYTLTVNENKNILGNDYAYVGHSVNGRIDKRYDDKLTGYLNGRVALNLYTNPDSSTNFKRYRQTFSFGVGAGVNYRYDSWVSFFASYNFMTQYSNLPVGFIYNEIQSVEGRQSTSLGSFVNNSINAGVRMNF